MASNVSQSVRDCLLNRTRETGEDHQVVLIRFALERLLYRMTQLPEGDDFALKGGIRVSRLVSRWSLDRRMRLARPSEGPESLWERRLRRGWHSPVPRSAYSEYRGWDSNPHGAQAPTDFKSVASTNSATPAGGGCAGHLSVGYANAPSR